VTLRLDVSPDAEPVLSDQERWLAGRFAFPRDRRRYVVARARLRELLGERLGVRPETVELTYGPNGKPALGPRFAWAKLHFNVSHCEDLAVFALATGRQVGIDVEAVRLMDDADAVAALCFSPAEYTVYRALPPRDRPLSFFQCWTRKEAFIKALGDGLSYPLDQFDVSLLPGEAARLLRVGDLPGDRCGWRIESFTPATGFVGAVVIERRLAWQQQ
jgi:4'-phosphopantetheinyl transferase